MDTLVIMGTTYINPPCCSFGDYGGAGSVGLANIREIVEWAGEDLHQANMNCVRRSAEKHEVYPLDDEIELRSLCIYTPPLVIHTYGDYSSEEVWLRDCEQTHELIDGLEDYPVLSEDRMSEIEMEWETEAWDDWLRSDLERAAWPEDHEPTNSSAYDALDDDDKFQAYHAAMDEANEYPEAENNGVHVRVERIADAYRRIIERQLVDSLTPPNQEA